MSSSSSTIINPMGMSSCSSRHRLHHHHHIIVLVRVIMDLIHPLLLHINNNNIVPVIMDQVVTSPLCILHHHTNKSCGSITISNINRGLQGRDRSVCPVRIILMSPCRITLEITITMTTGRGGTVMIMMIIIIQIKTNNVHEDLPNPNRAHRVTTPTQRLPRLITTRRKSPPPISVLTFHLMNQPPLTIKDVVSDTLTFVCAERKCWVDGRS
mmetsp:Transcript_32495/g.66151  ORF Transcript_32495/g.66151 Transcript_32495/m.66151 type:complete len:212 (-) Transcript_32495:1030-1665(-)